MDAGVATIIVALVGAIATILVTLLQNRKDSTKDTRKTKDLEVSTKNGAEIQGTSLSNSNIKKPLISNDDLGVEHVVGSMLYLPHRRKLEINPDVVTKAALKDKIEKSDSWAKVARSRTSLYDFLDWYYKPQGHTLLQRFNPITKENMKYPVTVVRITPQQENDPESVLGELDPTKKEEELGKKSPFVSVDDWAWFQRIALRPDNYHDDGIKYIMNSIKKKPLKISAALGWYFDVLRTCDSLEREILDYFGQHDPKPDDYENVLEQLTFRKQLHRKVKDPVLSGEGRSAALAMSVLIVYKHGNKYFCLIEKRSSKTAVHSNLYHVVPSFMIAPEYGSWHGEWKVWHQFQREYLEEVLGIKETEIPPPNMEFQYDWFYNHPELQKLSRLIREKDAYFYVTGITINLLNLRPEICGLLLIDSQEWVMSTSVSYNWEFAGLEETSGKKTEKIISVPIDNDRAILERVDFSPGKVVPPGSAALWLGVDKVRELAGKQT